MAQNYGLGRGLASLIPQKNKKITEPKEDFNYFGARTSGTAPLSVQNLEKSGVAEVEIKKIIPNRHQPRTNFDEMKLKELAASIKEHGVIQPIVVSRSEGGTFEIIAGERRFQASKIAGLQKIPVIFREAGEQERLELAIVENIQRHDLNPIEEAKSFQKLSDDFGLSQDEIALKLGKSRSAVANKVRLLNLPIEIQRALMEGKITEGHAKAILAIENPEKQRALFEIILKNNLTVRQTEEKTKEVTVKTHQRNMTVDPKIKEIENKISEAFGTKAKVTKSGRGGRIVIDYYSEEELDNILSLITK